jgi:CheY-like chemotaxis protein
MTLPPKSTYVIVADDDAVIRSILQAKLESLGQTVYLASDGEEACTLASQVQAALVLLDISMPNLDGVVACSKIRCLPGYSVTPIVMLTIDNSERTKAKAARAGATLLLVKPFDSTLMLRLAGFLRIGQDKLEELHAKAAGEAQTRRVTGIEEMEPNFSISYPD